LDFILLASINVYIYFYVYVAPESSKQLSLFI